MVLSVATLYYYAPHKGMAAVVKSLNELLKTEPALYHYNFSHEGFEWQEADDIDQSVYVYQRRSDKAKDTLVIAINLTPIYRENYRIGIPLNKNLEEIFNSDKKEYGGSNVYNVNLKTEAIAWNGRNFSCSMTLPPLGVLVFKLV